jgi:hypothetical protein
MDEKITWIKTWVYTGGDTPFNEIRQLMYHATTQANLGQRPDNVLWDEHKGEALLCVEGLKVKWSQWNGLYEALISRIQRQLEDITFSMPLPLPPSHVYIESPNDSRPGVNFATTLPEEHRHMRQKLLKHVLTKRGLRDEWVVSSHNGEVQWNRPIAERWMSKVDRLAGDLCLLGFLSSGPSGRGTEWAAMLAMNDQISNRSVYWTIKGLCFLDGYSKVRSLFFLPVPL